MVDRQTFNLRAGSSILPAPTAIQGFCGEAPAPRETRGAILGSQLSGSRDSGGAVSCPVPGTWRCLCVEVGERRNGRSSWSPAVKGGWVNAPKPDREHLPQQRPPRRGRAWYAQRPSRPQRPNREATPRPLSLHRLDIYRPTVYAVGVPGRTMQEATFLILTALAAGSQHGYGVISDVLAISDGRVRLRAGTLYSALDRLRIDGLVDVDREEVVDSRLRRYYRLTAEGRRQLAVEADRARSNAATALSRLDLAGGAPS